MLQDNLIQTNKANDGNGISTATDSLAFCVLIPPQKNRKPTDQDIIRYRNAKFMAHKRLWDALIGKDPRTGRYCC